MDIFQECREAVSARAAAERYGFTPNRSGFICCPFHGEKTASLKLYDGDRGFYCFGCHKGGSVIDFVAALFGISPFESVRKLDADFQLNLNYGQLTEAERAKRHFEKWLAEAREALHYAASACSVFGDFEAAQALDSALEALVGGDLEAQQRIFQHWEEVKALCAAMVSRAKLSKKN